MAIDPKRHPTRRIAKLIKKLVADPYFGKQQWRVREWREQYQRTVYCYGSKR